MPSRRIREPPLRRDRFDVSTIGRSFIAIRIASHAAINAARALDPAFYKKREADKWNVRTPGGEEETRLTLENIGRILASAGAGFDDVVRCGCFLADINDFDAMNGVYAGAPTVIGAGGAERIIEFPLDEAEKAMFAKSVASVRGLIDACKAIEPSLA